MPRTLLPIKQISKIRLFAAVLMVALIVITMGFWLLWFSQEQARYDSTVADVERHVDTARKALLDELSSLRFALEVLIDNPALTRYVQQPSPKNLQQLQQYFQWFIRSRPVNDQLRLLADTGQELVRVHQQHGRVVIVAKKDLQNKSGRDYFLAASSLQRGQVLLSRFDLNREHGKIEQPPKPTFRFVTPLFAKRDLKKVILVMNSSGQRILDRFRQAFGTEEAEFSLFNHQGFLLQQLDNIDRHPALLEKLKPWDFVFGGKSSFASSQPKLWSQIMSAPRKKLVTAQGIYIFTTIRPWKATRATASTWSSTIPVEQLSWKIVAFIPAVKAYTFFSEQGLGLYLKPYLLLLLLAALLCWWLADARAKYLEGLRQIKQLALYDPLTGLPNRVLLHDRWKQAIAEFRRNGKKIAFLFIDLDEFKAVNDEFGHKAGDALLRQVAARLQSCVRESDTVARIGGDEFVALLGKIDRFSDAGRAAGNIVQAIARPYVLGSQQISIQSSVGIAVYPDHGEHFGTILHEADIAMYEAKEKGKNQYAFRAEECLVLAT